MTPEMTPVLNGTKTLSFTLNGKAVTTECVAGESLLEVLRERLGVTSPKDGCSPQGQCGCCLALVEGKPLVTCAMPAEKAQGKTVLTLEGLTDEERERIARSFVSVAGLQCGFCIPGIALRAKSVIDKNPDPSAEEIEKALDVHLCRCTGYVRIVEAIQTAARSKREGKMPEVDLDGALGCNLGRYQGLEGTLGDRPYVDDLKRPGMLLGALKLSEHARARIKKIDVSRAVAMPGVRAVVTAADVPGERYYGLLYNDWPGFIAVGEETHCTGDVVAAVAAVDYRTAREACEAITVDYEVLPPLIEAEKALLADAPQVGPHGNLLSESRIQRGDVEAALAKSAFVVEETFRTQRIEHAYLEPESCLAEPTREGKIRIYTQGQGVFDDRRQCARFLGVREEDLEVELVPNGGAFGGKEDMSCQAQTALLCKVTGVPVKVRLTREESIRIHPKRHPIRMHYKVGCDAQGKLTAVRARMLGDSGAYASVGGKVLERAAGHACSAYDVPNVDVVAQAVYTNNPPCGAMRGFGANQAAFAMESIVDMLAAKVGMDPWEIRYKNALQVGSSFTTGQILEKSVGLKKTLEAVKPHYEKWKRAGRAVGIACGIKNSGIGNGVAEWGKARIVVEQDGTLTLYNGYTEMGQGLFTVLIQFAAEVTGLPSSLFHAKTDSTFALGCGQTTGSRATLFGGNAVISAAKKLRADLDAGKKLADLRGTVYAADIVITDTTALNAKVAKIKTHTSFGFATQVVVLDPEGKLERVIAAHDVGKAVNPNLCMGQIEGSIHMGLGYALTEELPCRDGMPVNQTMRGLGVLRARHMPEVEVILVEDPEPEGPFGAKGVGEIGLVPTAGAVGNALCKFDGKRRTVLPMKDAPAAKEILSKGVGWQGEYQPGVF
ncbi:MAG TPA: selenium-dependent xanthine dehydrogenase [Planctomycetota bacterium]|nr:selenium-dependent xanthine dehydrogenase [Planctomycetota bacterium]